MKKSLFIIIHVLGFCFVQNTNSQSQTLDILNIPTIDSLILKKAIEGDVDSQYKVGISYLEKERSPFFIKLTGPDEGEDALKWFEKAAVQGHKEASVEAGILYYERWRAPGSSGHDDWLRRQAISYLKNGGAENDPNLMLYFAELNLWCFDEQGHTKGSGKEAIMWCSKAINMGLPLKGEKPKHRKSENHTLSDAYFIMADIYRFKTIDTPENLEKYFANLELAVKYSEGDKYNGLPRLYLGECYYLGLGVEQDQEKANEIWDSLIKDNEWYKNDIKRIKDEYSGNNQGNNQYKLKTEEDALREFLNR